MMRRNAVLTAAVVVIGVGVVAVFAPGARADAPAAVGWWLDRDDNVPDEVMPPPDVPSGGLYISATITGAQAISAVRYLLEEGASPESLTLAVASSSGTVVLDACPPVEPWQPAQRGAWDDRPVPDCGDDGSRRVTGTVAADASTVTFALSDALVTSGLDLVLVPGVDPATSSTAVFDATFESPGAESLTVRAPSDSSDSSPDGAGSPVTTSAPPATDPSPAPAPSSATVDPGPAPMPGSSSQPMASSTSGSSLSAARPGDAFDVGESNFGATANGPLEMSSSRRAAAIAIFVTMLALLAWVNRDVLLVRAGASATAPIPVLPASPSERVIGVGRFARPRSGPTPPL